MTFDYAWAYGRERGARVWLTEQMRQLAHHYSAEAGASGQEVEGRVIASDLLALAQLADDGMADLESRRKGCGVMDDTRQAFTRRGYPDVDRKTCADCGTVYYSAGAHLERCPGPRKHQALGVCWCHRQHTIADAIALNKEES